MPPRTRRARTETPATIPAPTPTLDEAAAELRALAPADLTGATVDAHETYRGTEIRRLRGRGWYAGDAFMGITLINAKRKIDASLPPLEVVDDPLEVTPIPPALLAYRDQVVASVLAHDLEIVQAANALMTCHQLGIDGPHKLEPDAARTERLVAQPVRMLVETTLATYNPCGHLLCSLTPGAPCRNA